MLTGIIVMVLWAVILSLAMAESALAYASQAKLEDALDEPSRKNRYIRYHQRSGPARALCVGGRVIALGGLLTLLALEGAQNTGRVVGLMAAGAGAAALAELGGRFVGKKWGTTVLIVLLPPLQIGWYLVRPLRIFTGGEEESSEPAPDEQVVDAALEEIRVAVQDAATEGAIELDEKDMIEGVLEFEDVEVHELMTPRTDIECLDVSTPLKEAVPFMAEFHHTRIPVFEEVRDKIVGVLHVKDILPTLAHPKKNAAPLRELIRNPFFVPETKRAMSLLRDFKQRHLQIAIILDEYGGVTGLATLEDVMEQIVGELEEGFEAENIEDRIRTLGQGALDVDARLRVDEVNELLDIALPEDEDYDTVGGFMMASFASVPQTGEELRYNGALLRVLDSDDRRVHRVLLQKLPEDQNNS